MRVVKHPSSEKRMRLLWRRFLRLRDEHNRASNAMWSGMLAMAFSDADLRIVSDLLSPHDRALLALARKGGPNEPRPVWLNGPTGALVASDGKGE